MRSAFIVPGLLKLRRWSPQSTMSLESHPLNYERILLGCSAKCYQDQRKISVDHGYRYIQHCRLGWAYYISDLQGSLPCWCLDTHLISRSAYPRLVDLHAARACHPLSILSRNTRYLYVKNRDSYTIIAAIGLAVKRLRYNLIRLGRQREPGVLGALGP